MSSPRGLYEGWPVYDPAPAGVADAVHEPSRSARRLKLRDVMEAHTDATTHEHTLVFHYDHASRARNEDPHDVHASDLAEFEWQTAAMMKELTGFLRSHGIHHGIGYQVHVYLAEWQKTQAVPFVRRSLAMRLLRLGSLFDRTSRQEPFTVVLTPTTLVSVEPRISTTFGARVMRFLLRRSKDLDVSASEIIRGMVSLGLLAGVTALVASMAEDDPAAAGMPPALGGMMVLVSRRRRKPVVVRPRSARSRKQRASGDRKPLYTRPGR
jgi:hypothetical protein